MEYLSDNNIASSVLATFCHALAARLFTPQTLAADGRYVIRQMHSAASKCKPSSSSKPPPT
eukprot:5447273-Amphidinium_carterae.1